MTDGELVDAVAARAGISRSDARKALEALASVASEQGQLGQTIPLAAFGSCGSGPDCPEGCGPQAVQDLILKAQRHPLGVEFLLEGQVGAVAITFGAHAFAVEAARDYIRSHGVTVGGRSQSTR